MGQGQPYYCEDNMAFTGNRGSDVKIFRNHGVHASMLLQVMNNFSSRDLLH